MTIALDLDHVVAECGGHFTGRVSRQADADGVSSTSRARAVRLVLRYRTEGRGDTDRQDVSNLELELEPHGGLNTAFSLPVPPNGPVSYDGRMLRVLYEIEARVDVKLARDPKIERPVLVVPVGGLGVYDRPHPLPFDPSRFR